MAARRGRPAKKQKQEEIWPQERVADIEKWADERDEHLALAAKIKGDADNAELKLGEALKSHAKEVKRVGGNLIYKRGPYHAGVKIGKEKVYVKSSAKRVENSRP